jgi:predicted porin
MLVLATSFPLAAAAQEAKPAAPAPPAVSLYGTLNVNFQTSKAEGATTATQDVSSRMAVSTDSSNIGVRGSAGLLHDLKATFQCETSAALDGIGPAGICGRNSRVGLESPWGTLWYGNWDTPFKASAYGTKADDPFQNTDVFGYQSILGSPGFNYRSSGWKVATATAIGGFDVRASNSVGYWSPKYEGVSLKLQYSASEFKSATPPNTMIPELWSAVINYDNYGFSIFAAYDRHDHAFALNTVNAAAGGAFGSTAGNPTTIPTHDDAWRVGAGYQLDTEAGATTLGATFEMLKLEQERAPTGAITKYERQAFQVALKHRYGNHELRARYSMADKGTCSLAGGAACTTTNYAAAMIAVGYAYHLGPSTQTYLYYGQIMNEDNAQYTFTIGGAPAVAGATPRGADPQALALGIRHAF